MFWLAAAWVDLWIAESTGPYISCNTRRDLHNLVEHCYLHLKGKVFYTTCRFLQLCSCNYDRLTETTKKVDPSITFFQSWRTLGTEVCQKFVNQLSQISVTEK